MGAEDGGLVAIGDAGYIGLDVLIRDDRDEPLEQLAVGAAAEAVAAQVLHVGIAGQDLRQDTALDLVNIRGHVLDELEGRPVLLREAVVGERRGHRHGWGWGMITGKELGTERGGGVGVGKGRK